MSASMENVEEENVSYSNSYKYCLGEYGQHFDCKNCPLKWLCKSLTRNSKGRTRRYKGKYKGRGKYRGRDVY